MIQFILNNRLVKTTLSPGLTLLDFIRYNSSLTGTKIGCREGDCGACTVLVGELKNDQLEYRSATSCLMPIANAQGRHIVTIEGINFKELNPVQKAMSDEGATQCGFCTPGFIMSLAGFCLQNKNSNVVAAIDGNICRCTGYKSIERAGNRIVQLMSNRGSFDPVQYAVEKKVVPEYFSSIRNRLLELNEESQVAVEQQTKYFVGGGTDLYVQKHEEMVYASAKYVSGIAKMNEIMKEGNDCVIGASASVTDLIESPVIQTIFPEFLRYSKLVSSTPIRNMATIGGNFVNASPIGDFTVFFLALNARIILADGQAKREVYLRNFYKGYKQLDKKQEELISEIRFAIPNGEMLFNFEKVGKRTNLDIATVNSAICVTINDGVPDVSISAGGVGPIPMYLKKASTFISGKKLNEQIIQEVCKIASEEISPISDVRGSAEYKRLLLQQLIKAHFITLFPALIQPEKLLTHEEH